MKYICRIDRERHHCWQVGIAPKESWGVTKCFFDQKIGTKEKALVASKVWRNKELKRLKKHLADYIHKGWREEWIKKGEWLYLSISTSYKKKKKKFSVNKYGYEEAIEMAKKWKKEEERKTQ